MTENPFIAVALAQATPDDAAKIATKLRSQTKDNAPGAQAATNITPQASLDQLTSTFDVTKIPQSRLAQMFRDPTIQFAYFFIKAQIMRARWSIKCTNPQVAAFVDNALREIYPSLIQQYLLKLIFGYQAIVKRFETKPGLDWTYADPLDESNPEKLIWDQGSIDPLIWKPFVALPPLTVTPNWTTDGEFDGIKYKPVTTSDQNKAGNFDVLHSLWATNEKESVFGSLWGYPRIGYAYRFWWSFWFNWGLADRHFEKDADPPAIVYYPSNKPPIIENGVQRSRRDIALGIADQARSGSSIALPSDPIMADDGTTRNIREWELTFASGGGNFQVFSERFAQLRMMMLQAVMVPDQAFEAKGGTAGYNSTGQLQDTFQSSQVVLMSEFDFDLNRYVIPQLVAANFPELVAQGVKATKVTRGFDTEDVELAKIIIQGIANKDASQLNLDMDAMVDAVGLPRMSAAAIAKRDADLAAKAQGTAPEVQPAVDGQQAGVNEQGLYYAPREVIRLSEQDEESRSVFMAELTAVAALRDPIILSDAQRMRSTWHQSLQYDLSIASNLLLDYNGKLNLDEDFFERFYRRAKSRAHETALTTRRALGNIMRRASTTEFEKVGLSDFSWDPRDSKQAADYLAGRAEVMTNSITNTTRDQVKTFLSELVKKNTPVEEMGQLLNAHFRMVSHWRSDQIVRTEVSRAYNMATLLAAEEAGIKQVQAIDAQLGPDRSDPECIARNGRVYTLAEAFVEQEKEHPNGTLQWRILTKPVKVKRLPIPKDRPAGVLASYEENDDEVIVTLSEGINEPQVNAYLLQVVDAVQAPKPQLVGSNPFTVDNGFAEAA